jgi:hypothetical protein
MARLAKIDHKTPTDGLLEQVMDRRQLLESGVRLGVGVALVGAVPLLASCDVEGDEANARGGHKCGGKKHKRLGKNGSGPAPEAEVLVSPHAMGDIIDDTYRLVAMERAPDSHLRLHLEHVKRGGGLEVEIFRRDEGPTQPIAATANWEFYSFNTNEGPVDTPAHVKDVIAQVALIVAMHEDETKMVELNGGVCTFADRISGPLAA